MSVISINKENTPTTAISKVVQNRVLSGLIFSFLPGKENGEAAAATCKDWSKVALNHFDGNNFLFLAAKRGLKSPQISALLQERSNIRVIDLSALRCGLFKDPKSFSQMLEMIVSSCPQVQTLTTPRMHRAMN